MARSFLAILRGSDGRSLARALAVLVLLNAIVGSFHSAALAAVPEIGALCTVDGRGDMPPPAGNHGHDYACCVLGCARLKWRRSPAGAPFPCPLTPIFGRLSVPLPASRRNPTVIAGPPRAGRLSSPEFPT